MGLDMAVFVLADSAGRSGTQPPPLELCWCSLVREGSFPADTPALEWEERASGPELLGQAPLPAPPSRLQAACRAQALAARGRVLFAGTGNITEDMEKQLQANDIRIGVLEQENARLRAALAKVKAAARQGVLQVRLRPSRGWEPAGEGHTCWWGTACPRTTLHTLPCALRGPVPSLHLCRG